MAHEQLKNGNALRFLKDYWFILVFIVSISFGWANIEAKINELGHDRFYGKDGQILEAEISENRNNINRIDSTLIRIETKLDKVLENGKR